MFKLNHKECHNAPLYKLLQNGLRFALLSSAGEEILNKTGSCSIEYVLKTDRYSYKLDIPKKQFKGSSVVEIKSLLMD
ncbi:hypothetical protein K3712_000528 [Escherichia coli]|nr:hypothetical protein [Escherichia coli]